MGGETSHCPSETCNARKPSKILRSKHGNCQTAASLATSFALLVHDEEMDEIGDGLQDLGIEIGVEFLF